MKNEKQPKNSKSVSKVKIGTFIVIFFLLLYVPSLLHWVYGKNIGTEIIRMGTIEQAYNTDATIVRNEESLKSPFDGKYIPAILDGERVPANFRIASVFTGSSEKLRDELKDLDIRIIKAQQQKSDNEEFFSEDVVKIENEIYQKVKLLVSENDTNSLMKTKQIKDGIDELVQKKALIIGSSSTSDAFLKSLKEEKAKLQDKIKMNTKEIYSATAGVISYSVDGYESQLGPNVIRSMTPKFLNDIKSQLKQSSNVDNTIAAEKPFAKIIKDVEYYFVTVLDPDKAKLFRVDDVINVRVNDIGKVYDGVVDYKSEIQEGKCILSVKLDKGISDTAALRKTNVDLIKNYYQGLKVPVSCLRNIDLKEMKAEIILDKANYADVRSIKIIGKNEEWAVIESLKSSGAEGVSLYDIYVINPENIREGQMINE